MSTRTAAAAAAFSKSRKRARAEDVAPRAFPAAYQELAMFAKMREYISSDAFHVFRDLILIDMTRATMDMLGLERKAASKRVRRWMKAESMIPLKCEDTLKFLEVGSNHLDGVDFGANPKSSVLAFKYQVPGADGRAKTMGTFATAMKYLLSLKARAASELRSFSASVVVRCAAGDQVFLDECKATAAALDPAIRAVLMSGIATDDDSILKAQEVLATSPNAVDIEDPSPLPKRQKLLTLPAPERRPYLLENFCVPLDADPSPELMQVVASLGRGVDYDALMGLVNKWFLFQRDEAASNRAQKAEEAAAARAAAAAVRVHERELAVLKDGAIISNAREQRLTMHAQEANIRKAEERQLKKKRLEIKQAKEDALNKKAEAEAAVFKIQSETTAYLAKVQADVKAKAVEAKAKEAEDIRAEQRLDKQIHLATISASRTPTSPQAGTPRKAPILLEFNKIPHSSPDYGKLVAHCFVCNAHCCTLANSVIVRAMDGTLSIKCQPCGKASRKRGQEVLKAAKWDRIRMATWIRQEGLASAGQCRGCLKAVPFGDFHCAHNTADCEGGLREVTNLRVSCASCNLGSGTAVFDAYACEQRNVDVAALGSLHPMGLVKKATEWFFARDGAAPSAAVKALM